MDVHVADLAKLAQLGFARPDILPLGRKGASDKRYYRIAGTPPRLALISDPETIALTLSATTVARDRGIRTPKLSALHPEEGIAIMEDAGDRHLRDLERDPASYAAGIEISLDILASVPAMPPSRLVPDLAVDKIISDLLLFRDEFRSKYVPNPDTARNEFDSLAELAHELPANSHLALGDVSPDNIMIDGDVADREAYIFIDIQDSLRMPFGFDAISLVQDVRSSSLAASRDRLYSILESRAPDAEAARAIPMLGAFRLLRIAGTFARLDRMSPGRNYLQYIPYVRSELAFLAARPGLERLADMAQLDSWNV